ncbi:GNAT family N-acetyltransferase [Calidifontibacter sp. DB0510]|uniref:GNAT family N-acetyltransferase n=2 Tax=Metallococcus carri TaxID=1656884 RepID=A0A967E8E9_9MICO|nr:GNAT family N-acetyltransferase [Metallococcus carri]NOP36219.1 GNAT family N-acetyltransferase [Calidifontibacter sp. DB2511S]
MVRRARPTDVAALVDLRAAMFEAMGTDASGEEWRRQAATWFEDRIDDADYCFAVVEVDGRVVSCAVGAVRDAAPSPSAPHGRDVLISNVCTADSRGRGHGEAAFEAVMSWAGRLGISRAELMATASGRTIYERAGFREVTFPAMRAALAHRSAERRRP